MRWDKRKPSVLPSAGDKSTFPFQWQSSLRDLISETLSLQKGLGNFLGSAHPEMRISKDG